MAVAARKKKDERNGNGARAFAVLVEDLRGQFRAFGERLEGIDERMTTGFARIDGRLDGIDGRLDGIDGRLDGIDGRLDGIDGRLDGIDGRLDGVDGRLDRVEHRLHHVEGELRGVVHELGLVKTASLEHGRMLKNMVRRDEVEAIVDRAMSRSPR
jgi:archaellum component FlaC